MIRRALILLAIVCIAPIAASTPAAIIDCGTLSGRGVVRLHVGDAVYRVVVDCGVKA